MSEQIKIVGRSVTKFFVTSEQLNQLIDCPHYSTSNRCEFLRGTECPYYKMCSIADRKASLLDENKEKKKSDFGKDTVKQFKKFKKTVIERNG